MSLCAVGITGCFDAPPEYSVPERVPPLLDEASATPAISDLYELKLPKTDLNIPFRVSATEEDVQAVFIIDLGEDGEVTLFTDRPARGESLFACAQAWANYTRPGCHTVTVRASYVPNFGDGPAVKDPNLATEATWFTSLVNPASTVPPVECFPRGAP
jgi:hypothetical protein